MDQLPEITNIKNEPTNSILSNRLKISTEMQLNSFKQKSDCLVQSEIYIKVEPSEDGSEFPVIADTSHEICSYDDFKIETDERLIKIECEDMVDEIMQDPLDVGNEIKDEEHFPVDLDQGEPRTKTEEKKEEKILESEEKDSYGNNSNQDQLLIRNDLDHKDKKYICNECNKTFEWKSYLDRHLCIHTSEKPYTCSICEKSFNRKSTLDTHMLIHSGDKPHICDVCKKSFCQKSTLNEHKLIHSGVKPFVCDDCNKSFTMKQQLYVHKRIHTGEKPFTCDLCNKAFTQKSTLTRHRLLHTGKKPYCCDICSKSFIQKEHLNNHKRIHEH